MALEILINDLKTALGAAITSTVATSITVSGSYSGIGVTPTGGNFRIRIDNELLLVTAISGTTWTVTRGVENTTSATHTNGTSVYIVPTAGAIYQMTADANIADLYANRPTSLPPAGYAYFADNGYHLFVSSGSQWDSFGPIYPLTQPPLSGWTLVNGTNSGVSVDFTRGVVNMATAGPVSGAGSDNLAILYRAAPTTPFGLDTLIQGSFNITASGYCGYGMCLYDSVNNKSLIFGVNAGSFPIQVGCYSYSGNTLLATSTTPWTTVDSERARFMRMHLDSSGNVNCYISADYVNWQLVATTTLTYMGLTTAPDSVGLYIDPYSSGKGVAISVPHWWPN